MSSFSVATLQEKLSRLSASQESIETLSLWIIHHKAFSKTSVAVWADSFTNADPDHRLVLLYLANDILQNGRRKGADMFLDLFREPLQQVIPHIRGQKIQSSVERMFRIWRDRKVYDKAFVKQLDQLLSGEASEKEPKEEMRIEETLPPETLPDFKISLLEDAVLELRKFQGEMRVKEASVNSLPMDIWDASSLGLLKDKSEGKEFSCKFDKAWDTLKDYCDCLGIEVSERVNLSTMLASCLAHQAQELARVQQDVKMYKTLMAQLTSCREKLSVRQKDLERAQQTATSDPSCKEDLTEVGDMEIDSEEENMETQIPPAVQAQAIQPPPQIFNSASLMNSAPQSTSQIESQVVTSTPLMLASAPPMINTIPHLVNSAPQMINSAPHDIVPPTSHPPVLPYSQTFPPPVQGFCPPPMQPPGPQSFSRPRLPPVQTPQPSVLQMTPPRMQTPPTHVQVPPTGMSPRFPFVQGTPPLHPRGPVGPPRSCASLRPPGPPRLGMMQYSNTRLPPPRPPIQPQHHPTEGAASDVHLESKPVLYRTEAEQKPSLDDRLQSMVVKKSLGSVLLQEYGESDSENGEKPYTPTTDPLPASGSPDEADDDSVTTPTPQLDMSPVATPEDTGPPQFNPANPIMKALYHSPTHSPEEVDRERQSSTTADQPASAATAGESGSLLLGVDTGMLQNILKNVQGMIPATSHPLSPSPAASSEAPPSSSASLLSTPPKPPSSTPAPLTTTPQDKPATNPPPPSAADIKITSSLTNLLDEIFPQLSKSLQERKRKQEEDSPAGDGNAVKQVKVDGVQGQPRMMGPNNVLRPLAPQRPPRPPQPNGPRPDGVFLPRGPPVMMHPTGPGGARPPPRMVLRPQGQRPPMEVPRIRGPPFEGNFRPCGPPRLEGNFRPQGPPRPGMQPVVERLQCPPGQRPPFGLRTPNSTPPPRQSFIPHSSYQPRGPLVSGQNLIRPLYGPRPIRPPPMPDGGPLRPLLPGMEPNHFIDSVKPPQSHDTLQPIPPSGMGMWPGRP